MKLKINSEQDKLAIMQLLTLSHTRSFLALVAEMVARNEHNNALHDDDAEIIIHRSLLADSYRSNPSIFGLKLLSKVFGYEDSAGYATPGAPHHVTIILHRERKPDDRRRTQAKPSIKSLIRDWLNLNLPQTDLLRIPIGDIPPCYLSHPEQLTYQIKRETNQRIKITRLKTKWLFGRKTAA